MNLFTCLRIGAITMPFLLAGCQTTSGLGGGFSGTAPAGAPEQLAERGLAAAQKGDAKTALPLLEAAVEQTGPNPINVFNLGLVQSQAGNHAAAAAWLRTYLAMAPDAPNAQQVRAEVRSLDAKASAAVDTILETALETVRRLPEIRKSDPYAKPDKVDAYESVAATASMLGRGNVVDRINAEKAATASRLGYDYDTRRSFEASADWRMERAATLGDVKTALMLWGTVKLADDKWQNISPISALGDFASLEAAQAFDAAPSDFQHASSQSIKYTVRRLLEDGHADAAETFQRSVSYQNNASDWSALWLATSFLNRGDIAKARQWAKSCQNSSNEYAGSRCKGLAGDVRALADHWRKSEINPFQPHVDTLVEYTGMMLRMGDVPGADILQDLFPHEEQKPCGKFCVKSRKIREAYMQVYARIAKGDFSSVSTALRNRKVWNESWRHDAFQDDVLGAALFQGKFDYAEEFLKANFSLRHHPELLRLLARRASELGDAARAARLEREADETLTRIRGGWFPKDADHAHRANTWFKLASTLQRDDRTGNLPKALQNAREKSGTDLMYTVLGIADAYDDAVEHTRILEDYLPTLRGESP